MSAVSLLVGLIPLVLIRPLCDCPRYFIGVAAIGLVSLICRPRIYRWLGGTYVAIALLFAFLDYRHGVEMRERIEQMQAESLRQQSSP